MRCFVAIDLPEDIRKKIEDIKSEINNKKFIKIASEPHITLKFIGEVEEKQKNHIIENLKKIEYEPFEVIIKGVGVFPNFKYIRVIWLGCFSKDLEKLAEIIRNQLKEFNPEDEKFIGHITIARLKNKADNDIYNFIEKYKNIEIGKFLVKEFKLKRSVLTQKGAIYSDLCQFELIK
jgi:2'-5' RNA ligase